MVNSTKGATMDYSQQVLLQLRLEEISDELTVITESELVEELRAEQRQIGAELDTIRS